MGQEQLNNIMALHVHKDKTNKLSMIDIANKFITNYPPLENLLID